MEYIKDYSTKTADEWFALKKWTGFLKRLPVGRTVGKECESERDVFSIRATAAALSANNSSCEFRYSVTTDIHNEKFIYVTATRK